MICVDGVVFVTDPTQSLELEAVFGCRAKHLTNSPHLCFVLELERCQCGLCRQSLFLLEAACAAVASTAVGTDVGSVMFSSVYSKPRVHVVALRHVETLGFAAAGRDLPC